MHRSPCPGVPEILSVRGHDVKERRLRRLCVRSAALSMRSVRRLLPTCFPTSIIPIPSSRFLFLAKSCALHWSSYGLLLLLRDSRLPRSSGRTAKSSRLRVNFILLPFPPLLPPSPRLGQETNSPITIPTLLIILDDAMAAQTRPRHASRSASSLPYRQRQGHVEEMLASSSRGSSASKAAALACEQQLTPSASRRTTKRLEKTSQRCSKAVWMLRSIFVLLVLVPYVTALSSGVQDAGRSEGVESGPARRLFESRHSHWSHEQRQDIGFTRQALKLHQDIWIELSTSSSSRATPR